MKPVSGKIFEEVWTYEIDLEEGHIQTTFFKGVNVELTSFDVTEPEAQEICDSLNQSHDEVIKLRKQVKELERIIELVKSSQEYKSFQK